jgi:hypothetical protein
VDEVKFRALLQEGHAALAQARFLDAFRSFTTALDLWRGDPYEDLPHGDFLARRTGLFEGKLAAQDGLLRARTEMLRDTQEAEALIPETADLYAQQPRREGRLLQHIRCLSLAGRTAEAASIVQDYSTRLQLEARVEPSLDFTGAVALYLRRDPSTLPAAWGSRVSLPHYTTPLLCRDQERDLIASLLRSDSTRLLTVTGPGRVGKTRLAAAAAQELAPELPGGVLWLDVRGARASGWLLEALATEMGIARSGQELRMALPRELGRRRTLVVLDGADESDYLRDVAVLMAAGPRLSILATRQAPLGLATEYPLEINPLSTSDGTHPSQSRIFVESLLEALGANQAGSWLPEFEARIAHSNGLPEQLEQIAFDALALRPVASAS